jgi:hypothetical protein
MAKTEIPRNDRALLAWGEKFAAALGDVPESVCVTRERADELRQLLAQFGQILDAAVPKRLGAFARDGRMMLRSRLRVSLCELSRVVDALPAMTNAWRAEFGLTPTHERMPRWVRAA